MPTFDVSFRARYADGSESRDTFKMEEQADIGIAIEAARGLFIESELQEGRSAPTGLLVDANQR